MLLKITLLPAGFGQGELSALAGLKLLPELSVLGDVPDGPLRNATILVYRVRVRLSAKV